MTIPRSHTPEYRIWHGMKSRCSNPKDPSFDNYGARGIKVCERWQKFETFIEDMGPRPSSVHTLERRDNDKGYSPDNCKWGTRSEQNNNRRNSLHLEKHPNNVLEKCVTNATDLAVRTKALYLECVRSFLTYVGTNPELWTVGTVEDWLASLLATRKPQTVRVYRKGIRYASKRYAKREKKEDFAAQTDAIKADAPIRKPVLELSELQCLLRTCEGENRTWADVRDYALIMVAARTGLRRGGMAAMNWSGINWENKTITTKQKGGGTITFETDDETLEALLAWRRVSLPQTSNSAVHQRGAVFVRSGVDLVGMSDFQIWYVFKSRAKQAKMRHVHPHLMRHTTVTMLREEGVSPMDIRRLTGQTEKTIEDIYTHSRKTGAVGSAMPSLASRKSQKTEKKTEP